MRKVKCFFILLSLSLIFVGCETKTVTSQSYKIHDDGRRKAITCITPIFDVNNISLPWSLSDDLTAALKVRLVKRGNVYLTNLSVEEIDMEDTSYEEVKNVHLDENVTLNLDYKSLKDKYPDSEFVVFMELSKHEIHPKQESKSFLDKLTPSYVLDMGLRLRIVDLRDDTPGLILHEMVEQSHLVPKQFASIDVENPMWGKKTYSISPLGFAHSYFVKEVSNRIENYLILAKTK